MPGAGQRLNVAAMTLALLMAVIPPSWALPSNQEICDVNADFALGREDYPAAIALHLKVLRAHNNNALTHYHLGFAYGMSGRITDEISEYLTAAKLGLVKWDLFLNLGLAYLGQSDWPNAIRALQIAVSHGPNHPEAPYNLAIAYEGDGRPDAALQAITASLHLAPNDPAEHNEKAIICAELGDFVCARDEWTHLVQSRPDYMPAAINLAVLTASHK
jgi:tetratricopeptide (TPR) repeat protein